MRTTYLRLDDFYHDDPRRCSSPEADYGVWWTEAPTAWPRWRVSYVKQTGEVYAVQMEEGGRVEVLAVVPPDPDKIYYRTLDHILEGWAEHCGELGSLAWVRERLAPYRS